MCFSRAANKSSASSVVFTLSNTDVGGGEESGMGKHIIMIVFLFIRLVGILVVSRILRSKFPRDESERTINCIFPVDVGLRNRIPIPLSLKLPSFLIKTLHLSQRHKYHITLIKIGFKYNGIKTFVHKLLLLRLPV